MVGCPGQQVVELWAALQLMEERAQEEESVAQEQEQGQVQELEWGWGPEQGPGGAGTEGEPLWVLQEVWERGQCKVEVQAEAEVGVQAWGSLAGIQQGGSKEAAAASHSPLEVAQSLVALASWCSFD